MNKRCIHLILSSVYLFLKIYDLIFINYINRELAVANCLPTYTLQCSASYTFQMFPKMLGKGHYSMRHFSNVL